MLDRQSGDVFFGAVCIVADRGMISAETLAEAEKRAWKYILGVRMRSSTEAKAVVGRAGRYAEVLFCSFLALLWRKELGDRLAGKGYHLEWADVVQDLNNLVEMEVAISGRGYVFRGQTSGVAGFQACGVAPAAHDTLLLNSSQVLPRRRKSVSPGHFQNRNLLTMDTLRQHGVEDELEDRTAGPSSRLAITTSRRYVSQITHFPGSGCSVRFLDGSVGNQRAAEDIIVIFLSTRTATIGAGFLYPSSWQLHLN
jgi:hypothetical protein